MLRSRVEFEPVPRAGVLAAWISSGACESLDLGEHLVLADGVQLPLCAWIAQRPGARAHCALPVSGDPRGLIGTPTQQSLALEAGQALVIGNDLLVPDELRPGLTVWHATDCQPPDRDPLAELPTIRDAEFALVTAVRETAAELAELNSERIRTSEDHAALEAIERLSRYSPLPPGSDPVAVRLLAMATRVRWAADRAGLRELADAARLAMTAAFNSAHESRGA